MTAKTDHPEGYAEGYSRGYAVGSRKVAKPTPGDDRKAFWRQAFLATLPSAMTASGWKRGEAPITSMESRIALAIDFADESIKQAVLKGRL